MLLEELYFSQYGSDIKPTFHALLKVFLCLTKHHTMKTCGVVKVQLHEFLTSSLDEGEWSTLHPCSSSRYPLDRSLGGPQSRSGLDSEKSLPGNELQSSSP